MSGPQNLFEAVRIYAYEAGSPSTSPDGAAARSVLARFHPEMPEMVELSATMLKASGIDVSESRLSSQRLTDALAREIVDRGAGNLGSYETRIATRDALRSFLVQESAAHALEERGGSGTNGAFFGEIGAGAAATAALKRQDVDIAPLFEQMSNQDLRHASAGAFDRLAPDSRERIAKVLEIDAKTLTDPRRVEMNRALSPVQETSPIMTPMARQHRRPSPAPVPVRQPSFGRRIAAAQQAAMAGHAR